MPDRILLLVTVAVALVVASFHVHLKKDPDYRFINQFSVEAARSRDWIGRYPPELDVQTIDGARFRLSDHVGGEVVVLNFFATWCGPCREEMPELQRFVTSHAGQPVTFLALDAHEDLDVVRKYRTAANLTLPVAIVQNDVLKQFGVDSYPTTVLIGPEGTVRLYETGAIANTDVTFEPILREALPRIAQHRGITAEEFLKRSAAETARPASMAVSDDGPKLTGRALRIAQSMNCVCGCSDTVQDCKCSTATKMKEKLAKGHFEKKSDAEIKTELNAEFCMKGGM